MARKAWLLTLETPEETKTVDVINARKKIAVVEAHLSMLYEQITGLPPETPVTRMSGQEVLLSVEANTMRGILTMVDDETLSRFSISDDTDW